MYLHIIERRIGSDLGLINSRSQTLCILDETGAEVWKLLKQTGDFSQLQKLVNLPASEQADFSEFCEDLSTFIHSDEANISIGVSLHKYFFSQGVPLVVGLEINTGCPLYCKHCYNSLRSPVENELTKYPNQELSLETVQSLASDLNALGTPFVIVTGGEPLEHPKFLEICNTLSSSGIALKVFTNGWYMTPEIAQSLKKMNVFLVGFTLFGANATQHEYISQVDGSFDRIVDAIHMTIDVGIPADVTFFLMQHNFSERIAMEEWAKKEFGLIPSFSFSMTPRENGEKLPFNLEISTDNMATFFQEIGVVRETLQCGDESMVPCTAGKTLVAIKANGDVVPCVSLVHPVGNVYTSSFQNIWYNSIELKRFRELKLVDIDGCAQCEYSHFCLRCFVNAQFLGHNVFGKDPHACLVSRTYAHVQKQYRKEVYREAKKSATDKSSQ